MEREKETQMGSYSVAVLAGDGIGPEVTAEASRVLQAVAKRFDHKLKLREAPVGQAAVAVNGVAISDETMALCQQSDAILFGAIGDAKPGNTDRRADPGFALLSLRKNFELFANVRPVHPYSALAAASTLKRDVLRGVDLLVVRELTGGLYFGRPSEIVESDAGASAVDTMVYTEAEIERIVRYAFDVARLRRKRVTSVDKANVLNCSRLWRRVATRVAAEYPDVTMNHLLVDSCAMVLIRNPREFDVIVTENTFGDILTDEASMLAGSLGMLPSASLGTRQTTHGQFGLFEPIHGSAPDIAGQGKANPIAAILSAALLLRYSLGLAEEADLIERAVQQTIAAGHRTADIIRKGEKPLSTREMGEQILGRVTA